MERSHRSRVVFVRPFGLRIQFEKVRFPVVEPNHKKSRDIDS